MNKKLYFLCFEYIILFILNTHRNLKIKFTEHQNGINGHLPIFGHLCALNKDYLWEFLFFVAFIVEAGLYDSAVDSILNALYAAYILACIVFAFMIIACIVVLVGINQVFNSKQS